MTTRRDNFLNPLRTACARTRMRHWTACVAILAAVVASASIASAQPGWTPPFDLAAGTTSTRDPVFGIDSAGNAVALWTEGTEIRASHFLASSSVWSAPVRVSPAGDQVRFPSVDVNGSGRAIAAWSNRGPSGTAATVQASSFSTQTMQWSAPQTLATDVPNGGAQVELDDAGNAMAMWKGSNGYRDMVARYDAASATWGAPVSLTFADNASAGLYVAGSGDAMVMVAYSGPQAGGAPDVHRYQASTATWHQPVRFTGPGTGQVPGAWLAAGTSGRFLAVWLSFTGTVPSLQSSLFDPVVGAFSAPTLVATGYLRGTVALGDEVGLFVGYDSVTRMVKSARFDVASRTWSALTDFGTAGLERPETGPGSAIAIRAAMTPAGLGVATWDARVAGVNYVRTARYAPLTSSWEPFADLAPAGSHSLAVGSTGSAVAGWLARPAGGQPSVQVSRYVEGTTSPVLAPAVINRPSVALSWTAPTAGPPPTGYTVVASLAPGGPPVASLPTGMQQSLSVSAPDGTYYVRVLAQINGAPVSSNEIRVDVAPPQTPSAPVNLTATVSGSVVTFAWQPPANSGGAAVSNYVLEAGTAPGLSSLASMPLGIVNSFVTPPVPDYAYFVRLRAQNAAGLGAATSDLRVVVGAPPPGAPTLTGSGGAGGTATLSWSVPGSGAPPTGYQLRAGTQPGASNAAVLDLPASSTSFSTQGVPSGTYFVRIVATSALGLGDVSNEVTIVVP